jgi:hypothetical protein
MSSLRNLSDTLAAARLRAARSGDTLRSLLSPSSQGTGAPLYTGTGVSFTQLGLQMAGLSTAASSGGEGGRGEFSIRAVGGTGARDLSLFVLAPDLLLQLCLGAVNGGIKFCTLPCDSAMEIAPMKFFEKKILRSNPTPYPARMPRYPYVLLTLGRPHIVLVLCIPRLMHVLYIQHNTH